LYRRLIKWLANQPDDPSELRNATRIQEPGVVVYYWDGATPSGRQLRDISLTGAYLYTPERWFPGTVVRLLIQPAASEPTDAGNPSPGSVSLQARLVWHGPDGIALEFLFHGPADRKILEEFVARSREDRPSSPDSTIGSKTRLAAGEAT
jgi:PilZ domain